MDSLAQKNICLSVGAIKYLFSDLLMERGKKQSQICAEGCEEEHITLSFELSAKWGKTGSSGV